MIALLHYAYLKGMRDRSLPVFALMAPVQLAAMTIGFAVATRQLRYPLIALNMDSGDVAAMSILMPSFVATLSAFWTLRTEVATRAIGSFVVATRPVTVVIALVAFATATAIAGMIAAIGAVIILTAQFPEALASVMWLASIASLAGASLGALYVTLFPQPAMLLWSFVAGVPFVPFVFDPANWNRLAVANLILTVICIAVSTFVLRRRCAT